MRVLIVEDEAFLAIWMQDVLQNAGHDVIGIACARETVLTAAHQDSPDLVLMDINLRSDRGLGIHLARAIRDDLNIPSLFVSGQSDEARANADAAIGFLAKPFPTHSLLASVAAAEDLLHGRPLGKLPRGLEIFAAISIASSQAA